MSLRSLPYAPERDVPRLFVGNLPASISDLALRRAFSPFGTVRSVHRGTGFAHLALLPADAASVARCISSLHHTRWLGATLRVERAREHYASRLQREWAVASRLARAAVVTVHDGADGQPCRDGVSTARLEHHKWAGTRRVFADDREECDAHATPPPADDDVPLHSRSAQTETPRPPQPPRAAKRVQPIRRIWEEVVENGEGGVAPKSKRARGEADTLQSTVALFGLGGDAAGESPVTADGDEAGDAGRPAEVQRVAVGDEMGVGVHANARYDRLVREAENNPGAVDVEMERQMGRVVLERMFPGVDDGGEARLTPESKPQQGEGMTGVVARVRRAGRFREFGRVGGKAVWEGRRWTPMPGDGGVQRMAKKRREWEAGGAKKGAGEATGVPSVDVRAGCLSRRKGLFRQVLQARDDNRMCAHPRV